MLGLPRVLLCTSSSDIRLKSIFSFYSWTESKLNLSLKKKQNMFVYSSESSLHIQTNTEYTDLTSLHSLYWFIKGVISVQRNSATPASHLNMNSLYIQTSLLLFGGWLLPFLTVRNSKMNFRLNLQGILSTENLYHIWSGLVDV